MNIGRRNGRHDEGFTVVEVVVASFVLFFVITAVLGLTVTNTNMSITAKQRTIMTNAVMSHFEQIRSLDFEDVGTGSDGSVPADSTESVDGFTVSTQTTISQGSSGTKDIRVTVTVSREGLNPVSTTQFLSLKDKEQAFVTASDDTGGPLIEFGSDMPAEGAVLYGNTVFGGSTLYVSAEVESQDGIATIDELKFTCGGALIRSGTSPTSPEANWTPMTSSVSQSFRWQTLQVEPTLEDGWQDVSVIAIDSNGMQSSKMRRFYLDNEPPEPPGLPEATVMNNTLTELEWEASMDGKNPALEYGIWPARVGMDGQLVYTVDPGDPPLKAATNAYDHVGQSFSRYRVDVGALSPRYQSPDMADRRSTAPYVTRPLLTGTSHTTYASRDWKTTVYLSVTPPTFAVSQVRYDVYRGLTPDSVTTLFAADCGPTFNNEGSPITKRVPNDRTPPDTWHFQYVITYTPSGFMGGTQQVIKSNVIGPITATKDVTTPMAHVMW